MTPRQQRQDSMLDQLGRAIRAICIVALFIMAIIGFYTVGPSLETRFWPVTSKITVLKMEPGPGDTTLVWVEFTKYRDCPFGYVAWYLGAQATEFSRVTIDTSPAGGNPPPSPTRPTGKQTAGPWRVWVPPDYFMATSFGQVFHNCHPFWTSRSEFHP